MAAAHVLAMTMFSLFIGKSICIPMTSESETHNIVAAVILTTATEASKCVPHKMSVMGLASMIRPMVSGREIPKMK